MKKSSVNPILKGEQEVPLREYRGGFYKKVGGKTMLLRYNSRKKSAAKRFADNIRGERTPDKKYRYDNVRVSPFVQEGEKRWGVFVTVRPV